MRVLYVEDNAMNRQVVRDMLDVAGASMTEAIDAEAGLKAVQEQEFDIVLMDVRMPGMDGLTAVKEMRKMPAPICNLPVIVVTADTSADLRERCEAVKADDVIMKPVALQELLSSMGRVLAQGKGADIVLD
ncbi:response regulator [Erythrobacter sp. YT30]|nr:response regulator [Erythrobacter sp. YT30]KWV93415.1 response regulator [Erythrobacter sp. YT30]